MTLTLHWWMLPIACFLFPILYRFARPYKDTGGYFGSMDLEGLVLFAICWAVGIGMLIGGWMK